MSDLDFANILEKSDRTLKRMRNGEAEFNIDDVNLSVSFFGSQIADLNKGNFLAKSHFRHHLIDKHKNNTEYSVILKKRPTITFAIQYYLMIDPAFAQNGYSVNEIKTFFEKLSWKYSSAYISSAMARSNPMIQISGTKIVRGKKINIYKPQTSLASE